MALTPNEVTDDPSPEGDSPDEKTSWPTEDDLVVKWVNDRKKKAESRLSDWYDSTRTAFEFYENKQWEDVDSKKLEREGRLPVVFNRVAATVNAICGQEVSNRQEVRFLPRKLGPVSPADPMNDAVKWIRDNCNAEDEDSDAFKDMVICGMGWTCSRMDYEENPEGEGRVIRWDPMLMRWDPAARRKNLADRKWTQADYWMTRADIAERWPKADVTGLASLERKSDRASPIDTSEAWKYNKDASGQELHDDQWRVIHHVERFTKVVHRVVNPMDGKIQTFEPAHFQAIQKKAQEQGIPLSANKVRVRVVWEAWTVGGVMLESGEAKIQKDFQYQAMTCFRERETGFWFGLVCFMLDPQRYANRMASLLMSILSTGAKGGLLYETGAFVNPQKAKKDWARFDSAIELTPGALIGGKFKAKDPVQLPNGVTEFMTFAISSIRDVTGVNIEMLGLREGDQPGVVESMRTKAGLTILAGVFDAMRLYRKRQGILLAEFVTKFLSDGRLIKIWGPEGQQFIPLVRNDDVVEYDLVIDESPASRDVKEKTWLVLQAIVPGMVQQGVQIPPSVMDYLPVPESLAIEFKKNLIQRQSQPPQPNPEIQKIQMQVQGQQQIAQGKAQGAMAAEQARAQADVQIEHDKAQVQMQLEAMKNAQQVQMDKMHFALEQQTTFLKTIIEQIGKVAAAEVTASKDTDQDARRFTSPQAYP